MGRKKRKAPIFTNKGQYNLQINSKQNNRIEFFFDYEKMTEAGKLYFHKPCFQTRQLIFCQLKSIYYHI